MSHFFDSVRSRKEPVENALIGHRAAACAHMVNASLREHEGHALGFREREVELVQPA